MEIKSTTIVGDIVRSNFKTAQLFEKNKIDFCCGGGISLSEACKNTNVDVDVLIPEIEAVLAKSDPDSKYIEQLELDELSDYIVKRHHSYVRENIPFLQQKLEKLCNAHGENHPELFEVKAMFDGAAENLTAHMQKEEMVLFPYIQKMVKYKQDGAYNADELGWVLQPISMMEAEHQVEGERFEKMSSITDNYTPPPDGCGTYRVSYQTLQEFEQDLHRHIHLENNILFRKAIALEKELMNKA
jgi:regulator of cell morphogenesis and NO signaling